MKYNWNSDDWKMDTDTRTVPIFFNQYRVRLRNGRLLEPVFPEQLRRGTCSHLRCDVCVIAFSNHGSVDRYTTCVYYWSIFDCWCSYNRLFLCRTLYKFITTSDERTCPRWERGLETSRKISLCRLPLT